MKKIGCLLGVLTLLTACANSRVPTNSNVQYSPAVSQGQVNQVTKTKYVPVPLPGQLQKIPKGALSSHPQFKGQTAVRVANHKALNVPNSTGYFNSIMTYDYSPGGLYQVYCAPLDVTDIEFQPGERITSVAAGDTLRWQVSKTYSGVGNNYQEHLLIKPTAPALRNSLVVTTDLRTYHLQLRSTDSTYMAVVRWNYEEGFVQNFSRSGAASNTPNLVGLNINQLQFNYQVKLLSGPQPDWMPSMVFSDGGKTYIKFPETMQQSPVLFIGHSAQSDQVINFRVMGSYYVVDSIVAEAQLRLGMPNQSVVQITRVGR